MFTGETYAPSKNFLNQCTPPPYPIATLATLDESLAMDDLRAHMNYSNCKVWKQPISDRAVIAGDDSFHTECFEQHSIYVE